MKYHLPMNKTTPDPSLSGSIRLRQSYWKKFRGLMQRRGNRQWLERAIDRECKKDEKKAAP